ncbi:lysozyme inhibitor LprI family protein [Paraburkholderia phenazinium]|jgi:uncharacterized protein YecT (DUF1311 family)|uniref:Lysozyme inhibitor LprI-like N-terminal domain-containing protein n=1 Tax=Paraburkholderia phenazinium TaxID=60549 RepID=A0A1N6LFG4_9BURK|nr:Protein of unknown function [Paraburkholderia phenazinium]
MARLQRIGGAWLLAAAVVLTMASTVTSSARAEVAAADPIDAAMRACLARSDMSSTAGQLQCMETARFGWQAALNTAWQQLLAKLPPARHKPWEDAQARWQASRDAQAPLLDAVFATRQGTMYQLAEADMQLQPVRDRALALRSAVAGAATGAAAPVRPRPCSADALCEHATFDMNRYYRRLLAKMPARARPALVRAQRAWTAYLVAASAVTDESGRVDIIGARVATLKRLSETVGSA